MSVEGSEYSLRRVRNDRKKRACGSARHPLALLPVPDGFNRNAQSRREFNLGQPRPLTQIFDSGTVTGSNPATGLKAGLAADVDGTSGNSRPSRISTIRPSAFRRKRCIPTSGRRMVGDTR